MTKTISKIKRLVAMNGHQKCVYCRRDCDFVFSERQSSPTIDHRIPKCRGGQNTEQNIVLSCKCCNGAKGDMTEIEFFHFRRTGILHPQYIEYLEEKLRKICGLKKYESAK